MLVVDTNVLLYAAEKSFNEHKKCKSLIESFRQQAPVWHITWNIVYEFLRVSTHPRVFAKPWTVKAAWGFIEALFEAEPSFSILSPTNRHREVVQQIFLELPIISGNLVHDAHTAILMKEHGIKKIYTRDSDFYRFPFLEVIDPML